MRIEYLEVMYFGDYKFVVELDTGSEMGAHQVTVWAARKTDVDSLPLTQFGVDQLLNALLEPHRSRLRAHLAAEKCLCRKPFEDDITNLLGSTSPEREGKQHPAQTRQKVRKLREQMKAAVQRLEANFLRRELRPLAREWFDHDLLQKEGYIFEEEHYLRDFYFEEVNDSYIRNFCRKFALDAEYREAALIEETHWARRNALFVRNLDAVLGKERSRSNTLYHDRKAYDLFYWLDIHAEKILAEPEYKYLKEIDSAFQPSATELDPYIRPAVEALNRIPGVTTRFSCQGISGKVRYQGYELLVVSPHAEHAYVSFSALEQPAYGMIMRLLPAFPSITLASRPCGFGQDVELRSTGDNLRFRRELLALAEYVLERVNDERKVGVSGP